MQVYGKDAQCDHCKEWWPIHLIQMMRSNNDHNGKWYDPICALEIIRNVHGDPELELNGESNKRLYAEALVIQTRRESHGKRTSGTPNRPP